VKSVLYYVIPEKIINGTLFYAMEYFLTLNEIEPTRLILKCDDGIFNYIMKIFKLKYDYDKSLDNYIVNSNYTSLLKIIDNNVLILDTRTYKKCKSLIKYDIYLYSENGDNDLFQTTYGFYDYQTFMRKNRLKLAFKYHRNYTSNKDMFVSSPNTHKTTFDSKQPNNYVNLLEYKHWHYNHNGFDTNNRFIPEARYFNKTLSHSDIKFDDSIEDRLTVDLEDLTLTTNDILIKDFLG
jgi:hypothetical protein